MKVITIGTDTKLFERDSAVQLRQMEYAARMEELHIVVCTVGKELYAERIGNLFIYPTHSKSKLHWVRDAYRLAKKVVTDNKFVRGQSVVSGQDAGESGLVAYLVSRTFTFPLQLQIHTDVFSPYFRHTFLNRVRVMLAWFLIPRATGIRAVSETIVASLHRHFPHHAFRMSVLPIFIDILAVRAREAKKDIKTDFPQFNFVVFMASRLTKEKNIETAIHAMKDVSATYPHVGLVIAGSGPEHIRLKLLVHDLGLGHNVVFIGWQDDLISYYKTANIFLLTSLYEGYGMSLIEAAACGSCIITTPVGVARDLFVDGQNAFICPVGDALCLTSRIEQLLSDNATRELFKLNIQASIQGLVIPRETYVTEYVALLEKLL